MRLIVVCLSVWVLRGCGWDDNEEAANHRTSCHPVYEGGCLDPDAYDYDCEVEPAMDLGTPAT